MRIWLEMASCAAEAGQAGAGAIAPEAMRENRSNLYKVWGDYCEQFLRSAPFLESQKRAMGGSLQLRKQIREQLEQWNHALQLATAEDIDRLMLTVRRLGEGFGEQFEQLNKRLDDLSTRLDALAGQAATRSNSSPAESTPVPSVASVRKPKRRHKNSRHE
jgi:hypothetical protein